MPEGTGGGRGGSGILNRTFRPVITWKVPRRTLRYTGSTNGNTVKESIASHDCVNTSGLLIVKSFVPPILYSYS
jgi:hypothetical protein